MATVEVTLALRQAALLFAVAQHLTANPHLHPVWVRGNDLQLVHDASAVDLLVWADSLANQCVTVSDIKGQAFVYVTGSLGSGTATVWNVVPGLLGWLELPRSAYGEPIELDVLRRFVSMRNGGGPGE
ncbi:hypothetical protein Q5530_15675 [Saccharothrix sp. BKS2]|uniref:hypothetical protein n=1 Tax=Saccharothrix sp. BKS2 TaxID=3064400 RepID=UPI0039E87765